MLECAREKARALITGMEQRGHPQLTESSALYLALVAIRKQVNLEAPPRGVVAELEQLVRQCDGELASLRPALEAAWRVARR